jgi:hypothetical protein
MLKMMMTGTMPGAADPAAEDEAKAVNFLQADGRVGPGTTESCYQSYSSSSEDSTGHTQHCRLLL